MYLGSQNSNCYCSLKGLVFSFFLISKIIRASKILTVKIKILVSKKDHWTMNVYFYLLTNYLLLIIYGGSTDDNCLLLLFFGMLLTSRGRVHTSSLKFFCYSWGNVAFNQSAPQSLRLCEASRVQNMILKH